MVVQGSVLYHQGGYRRLAFLLQEQIVSDAQANLRHQIHLTPVEQAGLSDRIANRGETIRVRFG